MARKKKEKEIPVVDSPEKILRELEENFQLHDGQKLLDVQLFDQKRKRIFAQCGRNWGKSVSIAYLVAKYACLNPKSGCYIICPQKEQAKEIYWSSGLLLSMIPSQYISKNQMNRDEAVKTELRIRLTNGSFIKLLGADEPNSLRGIKPHLCAYDEYRDFKANVYSLMEANLLGKNATLLIGSTPPDVVGQYSELRDDFIEQIKKGNQTYYYLELPTETNPHIDKETLLDIKRRLIAHGKLREWMREYMAKFISGGASAVFPMFIEKRDEIVKPWATLMEVLKPDADLIDWYALFDPATSSVFAVLLMGINKYTGQMYLMDEIYERDRFKTSSIDIWKRTNELKKPYMRKLERWENFYDEHESWFYRDLDRYEILTQEGTNLESTSKQSRDKNEDLAIIKDLMLSNQKCFIADRCVNLISEIESYATDKDGKLPKKNDHQIDNWRYGIAASGFTLNEQPNYEAYLERKAESKAMVEGFDTFMKNRRKQEDWTSDIDESAVFDDDVVFLEDFNTLELF